MMQFAFFGGSITSFFPTALQAYKIYLLFC